MQRENFSETTGSDQFDEPVARYRADMAAEFQGE
jgi:hypothetical protein